MPGLEAAEGTTVSSLARLLRERDQLILMHEALADVERAHSVEERLRVLAQAIRSMGYGRADTVFGYTLPPDARITSWISKSVYLDSGELIVPVRSVDGTTVATLVVGDATEAGPPVFSRVRTVELFAQQVASIIENARLFEESERQRRRAEELAERHRQLSEDERRARKDERERALALEQSEMRYARLVDAASDGIFTVDRRGLITSVNHSLEEASGRDRASLLGTPFADLVDSRDRMLLGEALDATFTGRRRRVTVRYTGVDQELRHSSLTFTPIVERDTVTSALGVVRDVTDEKRLTEQLLQQEKLAAVGQLVSGVAHELNNPLASVMAFAQLLEAAEPDSPADRRAVEAIGQEAKRAAKIVSNLLTFARQHQPERRIADLNRVVDDTLELRRYALRNAQIEVDVHFDASLPLTWADPFQLQQVVLNLVTNAEHALESWTGQRCIQLSTMRCGSLLAIRVADSGPGISPEHVDRIFNPFFTTKPVGEGTGLGLSISDGIVREHGGRIRVESHPGAGAAFFVEIPFVAPPPDDVVEPPTASRPSTASQRLLFVDDEGPLRIAVTTYFRSLGHEVDAVATGREALAQLEAKPYDALLLDLHLPDMGGEDVLMRLGALARGPRRVVFITGDTQSDASRRVIEASGHPAVCKPFLLDELAAIALAEAPA
ncbi:MAG TPA: ATP-binding protein [Gemmatimonadaceae bacterium]